MSDRVDLQQPQPIAARRGTISTVQSTVLLAAILTITIAVLVYKQAAASPPVVSGAPTVTQDTAIAIARSHVGSSAVLLGAAEGPFSTTVTDAAPGQPNSDISPTTAVWAIRFEAPIAICPPPPLASHPAVCLSPRAGFSTVVVDAQSGAWITTFVYSPSS